MARLESKTALVSGGAHGIGKAIAELFAEEGAWVLIADIDEDAGERAAGEIQSKGGSAVFCRTDVASESEVAKAVETAQSRTGAIDVLCNNAAYLGNFKGAVDSTGDEWTRCIEVSLLGTHRLTQLALPKMIERRSGSIVNVVSIQGMVGCPTSAAYTTVKSGLLGYTRSAAYDYGPHNVRVNALCPGPIQTRISPKPGAPNYQWQCDQTVLGRVGYPREVAYAALFLASEEASYITGVILPVDGGWTSK